MYLFNYDPITMVAFVCSGVTTGLAFNDRFIYGVLDPFDQFGVTMVAQGNTLAAIGTSNIALGTSNIALGTSNLAQGVSLLALGFTNAAVIGTAAASFGTDSSDPTSVYGFLKRALETREGNETYTKATGVLDIYSRGSSQLLREKTIADSTSTTTKT